MDETKTYSFAENLIPPDFSVCGIELRPFSLGHHILLEGCASPLLAETPNSEEATTPFEKPVENDLFLTEHLFLFVLICAHDWENNQKLLNDPEFFQVTKDDLQKKVLSYIKAQKFWSLHFELFVINEYLQYYVGTDAMPEFVEVGKPSEPSGLDWKQTIYSVLANEYGYSESKIMNMSMRRIFSEWVIIATKGGTVKVKPRNQIEMEKKGKNQIEELRGKLRKKEITLEQFFKTMAAATGK